MATNKTGEGRVGRGLTDWIYVDVDGTLLIWPTNPGSPTEAERLNANRRWMAWTTGDHVYWTYDSTTLPVVNEALVKEIVDWLEGRKRRGVAAKVAIWSMGGADHAELAFNLCFKMTLAAMSRGFMESDFLFLAKPDIMVDDGQRHLMTKHPVCLPGEFKCGTL